MNIAETLELARVQLTDCNEQIEGLRRSLLTAKPARMTTREVERLFTVTGHALGAMTTGFTPMIRAIEAMQAAVRGESGCPICQGAGIGPDGSACACVIFRAFPPDHGDFSASQEAT